MSSPWIFREIHHYLATGHRPHRCRSRASGHSFSAIALGRGPFRRRAPHMPRALPASWPIPGGMPAAKHLREQFSTVTSLGDLAAIAAKPPRGCRRSRSRGV